MERSKRRFAEEQSASPELRVACEVEPAAAGGCRVSLRLAGLSLPPPGTCFTVWAEQRSGPPIRLGELILQSNGCGHLSGTVGFDRFRLAVTLEDEEGAPAPSKAVVHRTDTLPPFRPFAWYGAAARAR